MVFRHLHRSFRLILHLASSIVDYLHWYDDACEFKYIYLSELLLGPNSNFRQFTHFHNERFGSISPSEDIIDRIISFVVHHVPTMW